MAKRKAETLPEEIIFDIVSRVPAKSVGRFRCVSKEWCSLLSGPLFIKAHLAFHKRDQPKLICVSDDGSLRIITFDNNSPKNAISSELNFHQLSHNWYAIAGSCNGLVLLLSELSELDVLYLVNPTTLQYHRICDPPNLDATSLQRITHYSLGYDIDSDDYKVVAVSTNTRHDVYSVRKGLWWRVEGLPCGYRIDCGYNGGVLVNGALHWSATRLTDRSIVILAFDSSSEKFSKMSIPTTLVGKNSIMAPGGFLCVLPYARNGKIDIWMMNEYRVSESWTKFQVERMNLFCLIPVFLMSNGDVVFENVGKLFVHNKKSHLREMMVDDGATSRSYRNCTTVMESLVSPMGN